MTGLGDPRTGGSRELPEAEELLAAVLHHRGKNLRPGQTLMVHEVEDTLRDPDAVVDGTSVKAPTGTGKTLAYITAGLSSDRRVVVCTTTKALQEQIAQNELPRLQRDLAELYGYRLTYAVLKGRGNYPCLDAARALTEGRSLDEDGLFSEIAAELETEDTAELREIITSTEEAMGDPDNPRLDCGDRMERLPSSVRSSVRATRSCGIRSARWWELGDDGDGGGDGEWDEDRRPLPPQEIAASSTCAYRTAYARAMIADVVVMNISLLAAELQRGQGYHPQSMRPLQLPGSQVVVVDEAHHLVPKLTDYMQASLDFAELSTTAEGHFKRLQRIRPDLKEVLAGYERTLEVAERRCVDGIDSSESMRELRGWLAEQLRALGSELNQLTWPVHTPPPDRALTAQERTRIDRAMSLLRDEVLQPIDDVAELLTKQTDEEHPEYVYAVSFAGGDDDEWLRVELVPLDLTTFRTDLADLCRAENPYIEAAGTARTEEDRQTLVLTSGTLTHTTARMVGMEDGRYVSVPSPFDPHMSRLCVPKELPEPYARDWEERAWRIAEEAITRVGGRTLMLCTSKEKVEAFTNRALASLTEFRILCQYDDYTREELLRMFAEDETSVLIGTSTFWEGVDVPGPSCSLVVIDKAPFPFREDPVMEARRKWAQRHDLDPFYEVDVDQAATRLAQGAGRLIRAETDRGGVLVLDPRIATKGYSTSILGLLPDQMPYTTETKPFLDWLDWVNPDTGGGAMPGMDGHSWRPVRPPRRARGRGRR